MTNIEEKRIEIAAACRDADYIPKVASAGLVDKTADGLFLQTMHNGIKVLADAYYDQFNTEIVRRLHGHHEPQEEKVFYEVLTRIQPGGVMIELGAYWAYYSLWFHKAIPRSTNYMIEGVAENLKVGQRNFQFNGFDGHFKHALVGKQASPGQVPPIITIDDFIKREALQRVAVLHADIQGHEYKMLLGARNSLQKRLFDFIFISSHGYKVHAQCLKLLRRYGYRIICEHTLGKVMRWMG
ncbi:MAG: FkbM family methyltransferase [Limisphaerales bacterium]